MRKSVLPELPLVSSVTFTYSGTAAPMCSWSWLGARRYVIRLDNATTRHLVAFAFLFVQTRCTAVSSSYNTVRTISVIINLLGQPSSETRRITPVKQSHLRLNASISATTKQTQCTLWPTFFAASVPNENE